MKFIGNLKTIRFIINTSIESNDVKNKALGFMFSKRAKRIKYRNVYIVDFKETYNITEFKVRKKRK